MRWPWTRRGTDQPPQPQPVPEEQPVMAALVPAPPPASEIRPHVHHSRWAEGLDTKYQAIRDAQMDMGIVLQELNTHVEQDHHGDIAECDVWCWPKSVRRVISLLPENERWVFLLVLLKDWYWRQAAMAPWLEDDEEEATEDDSGESDSEDD